MARIVNVHYKCCGLHFDAAIDCNWELHWYEESVEEREKTTPIELYCLDRKHWDIRMVFQKNTNDQRQEPNAIAHTFVDWDIIMKETRKWVREMRKKNKRLNK